MKSKEKRTGRTIFIFSIVVLIALILCYIIYYLADNVWNGTFVDWFTRNYMVSYDAYMDDGTPGRVTEPYWYGIKSLILLVLCFGVVLWLITIFAATRIYAKRKINQTVTDISTMIHSYMQGNGEAADIFPKEYAEVSTQIVEIKSTMQRHEQLLKEEAVRKNDLIVYLAHDLKTPLTSIIGYLSLLQEAPDMPAQQKAKYVNITLDKAQRLEKLINEFFDITRYNLQQIILEKENIDLYYMLVQMTDEFYPILNAHGNRITLQADENLTVYGDAEKLARVFNNILKNAIAYSYPDTEIKVLAECSGNEIHIEFQNKGKTIPEHKLESIFEKFFRLDEARSTNTGGAGLGLAIAKEIVTLHGGSITAYSENEQTSFQITLPATSIDE